MNVEPAGRRMRFSLQRSLVIVAVGSLLLIYPLLWLRVIRDPAERTAADFLPFYAAGRIAITEGMSKVYDLETERKTEDGILNATITQVYTSRGQVAPQSTGPEISLKELNPFPHPPFIIPLLTIIAYLDYVPAFVSWSLLMTLLLILSTGILVRLIPEAQGWMKWTLFLGTLLFFPGFFSIINGQDTAVLLLGASIWFYELIQERDRLSGLGLALTTIRPQMALILSLPLIFRRRKIFLWFCLGAGILVLVSLFILGRSGIVDYLRMLNFSANADGYKFFNEELMVNFIGFLRRTFSQTNPLKLRIIGWIGYGVAIIFLCVAAVKNVLVNEQYIGLLVIITILAVPHIHYHDLELLLVPLYSIMRILLKKDIMKIEHVTLLPLGLTIVLFVSYWIIPVLNYYILYSLMLLMLVVLWFPEKIVFWKKKTDQEVHA